ncbi:MAG: carbon-nitrogen family hydrolase [Anaerolineales bacterium]|jgi:predicted amidohydrolase
MKLTISLAQMAFKLGAPEANFAHAREWVVEAARRGSDLVLLPELWASGYDLENWETHATSLDEGLFLRVSELARENRIAIGSSLLEKSNGRAYNTFVLFDSEGTRLGVYRKVHLFRLIDEHTWLSAGESLVCSDTHWGRIGLSTCYDLRFPEMFRSFAVDGARLVLMVAEWPERRVEHWRVLLKARAVENQMFIAAVNKVGESKGVQLGGNSTVLNPWGRVLVEAGFEEVLLTTQIDLSEVDQVREWIPVFNDRRPEIYGGD